MTISSDFLRPGWLFEGLLRGRNEAKIRKWTQEYLENNTDYPVLITTSEQREVIITMIAQNPAKPVDAEWFKKDMKWLNDNRSAFIGRWVALKNGHMLEHSAVRDNVQQRVNTLPDKDEVAIYRVT